MMNISEDHPMLKIPMSNRIEDRVNGPSTLPTDEDWNPDALKRWSAWHKANEAQQASFEFETPMIAQMAPMNPYRFSKRSFGNLQGVDSRLQVVMGTAIQYSPFDFIVIEGLRTKERQAKLVKEGASMTMNSRHLTGHAVDLAIWLNGEINWDFENYKILNDHVQEIAKQHGVDITWGGEWKRFLDGPHFELTWGT